MDAPAHSFFVLSLKDKAKVAAWRISHDCRAVPDSFGAILTYCFTPCGIGDGVRAVCACGATLDLTDVEDW